MNEQNPAASAPVDPYELDRLAQSYGIQPDYNDIWGHHHAVSPETKRALLRAMSVPCDTREDAVQSLALRNAESWRRVLPPVAAGQIERGPLHVTLTVPANICGELWSWQIVLESGATQHGQVRPQELHRTEENSHEGEHFYRYVFPVPVPLPEGYHRLDLHGPNTARESCTLIVAPSRCHVPEELGGDRRIWGLAVQLYSLRSRRNWGVGDFTDLKLLADLCREAGANVIGLNPLHALFPNNPGHCSPYSPSSRLFLNVMYIDVEAAPELAKCPAARALITSADFQTRLAKVRGSELIDYPGVAALKRPVLELLYQTFMTEEVRHKSERAARFVEFRRERGEPLERLTVFEALAEHFHSRQPDAFWLKKWPDEYRDAFSEAVRSFGEKHAERVGFYAYLQWLADEQLADAQGHARARGLLLGLYRDLAVGTDSSGADAWSDSDVYTTMASVGAPPDELNTKGQDWGLPPPIPEAIRERGHAPFIEAVRENMRHAGALRFDHVMALMRLYWVPIGMGPAQGAYVTYPLEELLGIVALESQRQKCLVIGEDLGTVPDAVREALHRYAVLSYRILWFERESWGGLKSPSAYPALATCAAATHDTATLAGFWKAHDLEWRTRLHLYPSEEMRHRLEQGRPHERRHMLEAFQREGLLPHGVTTDPLASPELTLELDLAAHAYLARTPCKLMLVQVEELLGEVEQANLPGTVDEHPNWRRRMRIDLEDLPAQPHFAAMSAMLRQTRGR